MKISDDNIKIVNNRLTQVGRLWRFSKSRWQGVFRCSCGTSIVCDSKNVARGNTRSCGCYRSEVTLHVNKSRITHGMSNTRAYHVWEAMKQRCLNPKCHAYADYGGRGIGVSEEWMEFSGFLKDMGEPREGMTLDREDNNSGYCKENCRWVLCDIQHRNTRSNVMIEHGGLTMCVSEWARRFGFEPEMFRNRLKRLSFEDAISIPVKKRKRGSNGSKAS